MNVLSDDAPMSSGIDEPRVVRIRDARGDGGAPGYASRRALHREPAVQPVHTGLGGPFDPNMSKALYSLSDSPEFLFDEERSMKRRSWSENLTFLTGLGYLAARSRGGRGRVPGLDKQTRGWHDREQAAAAEPRAQRGRRGGAALGNAWGCIGLYYAAIESLVGHYADQEYPALTAIQRRAAAPVAVQEYAGSEGDGGVRRGARVSPRRTRSDKPSREGSRKARDRRVDATTHLKTTHSFHSRRIRFARRRAPSFARARASAARFTLASK